MTTKHEQLRVAEALVEQIKAEIEATENALAQTKSYYPAKGTRGFFLKNTGGIFERGFDDDDIDRDFYDQGTWFATREQAELKPASPLSGEQLTVVLEYGE